MNKTIVNYSQKKGDWIMWIQIIAKNNFVIEFFKPNMNELQSLGKHFFRIWPGFDYQRFSAIFWAESATF